ncbi:hypothetical protein Aspvir_003381 [Aspergillus viridinutans]|uniref:Uncharacterized protein n=1 Tax=Aspergillus viridinutans TaxID=75553 RepID=A0A9P3C4R2_ASPVI|nr:uncharacterized protein Aspvir_003381 [Aspergillus viridinutans]GIK07714.1 hypothetical protein Aspvir_003381 [Aspergillus viridinutans]
MSFETSKALVEKLICILRGESQPDLDMPVERILVDLWRQMRSIDSSATEDLLLATCSLWSAQGSDARREFKDLGSYIDYRICDGGSVIVSPLTRFAMGLRLTNDDIEAVKEITMNMARQIPLLNDICSWEKELKKARESKADGAQLCSAVKIIADTLKIDAAAAQRLLWHMCRELEARHVQLAGEILAVYPHLSSYCRAIGYPMSGQEVWALQSERFNYARSLGIMHPFSEG